MHDFSKAMKHNIHHNPNTKIMLFTWITLFTVFMIKVRSSPPPEPITCINNNNSNCTITNYMGSFPDRTICRAGAASYPTTESELISAVANATALKRKIKVATAHSHSIPKLVCPDGEDGLLISTKYLNRTLDVNVSARTMTVESGMTLRKLIDEAARAGLALPYAPYWWGVTVGGMLGTGAHGSSLWGLGSQVHDYVVRMTIVSPGNADEGYVKVRKLEVGNPELDAAKVSLGVLGVILQVIYRFDDRVPYNTSGNGLYDFIGFRSTPSLQLAALRTAEETQESLEDANGKCVNGKLTTSVLELSAFGLTNNGLLFTVYPVIGFQNHLQSSGGCLDSPEDGLTTSCPWDPRNKGLFYYESGFSIALAKVNHFIKDIKKLVSLQPKSMCVVELYNGILMRYVTASSAYLGKQKDSLAFDITYYRSKDPLAPRLFEDIFEEIEQIALFKYKALPHWGKNRNVAFRGAIKKFNKAKKFLRIKRLYDPLGLFSSDWTDQVLGLKDGLTILKDGCALDGLCICSQDSHCAPEKGYFCRPGKIYKKARVCTREV